MNETKVSFHVDPAKATQAGAVASDADRLVLGFPGPAALFDARGALLSEMEESHVPPRPMGKFKGLRPAGKHHEISCVSSCSNVEVEIRDIDSS